MIAYMVFVHNTYFPLAFFLDEQKAKEYVKEISNSFTYMDYRLSPIEIKE